MSHQLPEPRRRIEPATVSDWAVALREPLKLAVIVTAWVFAIWLLLSATNPVGLTLLLGWALWERPWHGPGP